MGSLLIVLISEKNFVERTRTLPKIPFCANIGANAEMNKESSLMYQLDEVNQVKPSFEIILSKITRKDQRETKNEQLSGTPQNMIERRGKKRKIL